MIKRVKRLFTKWKTGLAIVLCLAALALLSSAASAAEGYTEASFAVEPQPRTAECSPCHGDAGPNSPMHSMITMARNTLANAVNIQGSGWFLTTGSLTDTGGPDMHALHSTNRWSGSLCIGCHRTPTCGDCHTNTIGHSNHGSTGMQGIPAAVQPGDCAACHGGLPNVNRIDMCKNCHSNHNVSPAGFSPDSGVACSDCHSTNTAQSVGELYGIHQKAANAGKIFNWGCTTCHNDRFLGIIGDGNFDMMQDGQPIYCTNCHDGVKAAVVNHKPDHQATSDLAVTCSGCHNGVKAKGSFNTRGQQVNISLGSIHPSCDTCHASTNQTVADFIYANRGQVNAVYKCDVCHNTLEPKHNIVHKVTTYTNQFPGQPWKDWSCGTCHGGDLSRIHTPRSTNTMDCDVCHGPNPSYPTTAGVILANLSNNPQRTGYTCQDCHPEATQPKHEHWIETNGYDPNPDTDCGTCHNANWDLNYVDVFALHARVADKYIPNFGCYTCHNSTFEGSVIIKDNVINMNGVYCTTCHDGVKAPVKETLHKPGHQPKYNGTDTRCLNCHAFPAAGTSVDITSPAIHPDGCKTCHGVNARIQVRWNIEKKIHVLTDPIPAISSKPWPPGSYSCELCHGANLDHDLNHQGTIEANCLTCHDPNLSKEHTNHPLRPGGNSVACDNCHESTRTEVTRAINLNNLNCAECHKTGHNLDFTNDFTVLPTKGQRVGWNSNFPVLPLYPGFQWSTPIEATIFKGSKFYPDSSYDKGQVIISNRLPGVTAAQVWDFYNRELTAQGWTNYSYNPNYISPKSGFLAYFSQNGATGDQIGYARLYLSIRYYTSENEDGTGPVLDGKTEIWYTYTTFPYQGF